MVLTWKKPSPSIATANGSSVARSSPCVNILVMAAVLEPSPTSAATGFKSPALLVDLDWRF